ncbi:TRAP transporter small permease subunit [Nocardiopsis sp. HNM0947]|uniref:TRAP transporter small permease subunit n=1 Tax=Nocardiopsis coralli TaxID=2772213 RepID=A0ABR9P349_9ACTN|nr:TRAP transporter small permease subunit [Nocardiopsis coralli]MBE2998283.1 TRAP transporter small permease subunit [Nocardiopsis coralli]
MPVFDFLTYRVFQPLAALALLSTMFIMAGNAVARIITGSSPGWVVTFLTELGMPAIVFFGLVYTTAVQGHIRVTSFVQNRPPRFRLAFRIVGWVCGVLFLVPIGLANAVTAVRRFDEPSGQAWSLHPSIAYGMVAVSTLVAAAVLVRFLLRPAEHAAAEEAHPG